jgi:hypothetical protein
MKSAGAGTRVRRDVLDSQRLDLVHHIVRAGLLEHPRNRSGPDVAGLAGVCGVVWLRLCAAAAAPSPASAALLGRGDIGNCGQRSSSGRSAPEELAQNGARRDWFLD